MSWNLDRAEIISVEVLQITIQEDYIEEIEEANRLRLLILSHSLAYRHNCCVFVDKCPEYSPRHFDGPGVLLFDLNDKSNDFSFPNWASIEKWVFNASQPITHDLLSDMQHSITLMQYYEYVQKKRDVLYFTSFILFSEGDDIQDNILLKTIPVVKSGKIRLRTHIQGKLSFIVDPPLSLLTRKRRTFVLMPPFENSFLIGEVNAATLKLIQVNKETVIVDPRKVRLVMLTDPPLPMQKYFDYSPSMHDISPKARNARKISSQAARKKALCDFKTKEYLDYTEDDIKDFFSQNMADNKECEKEVSELEFPAPQVDNLIYEQETDQRARKMIRIGLGKYHFPPSKRHLTTLVIASFLSFFRFDFGQSMASLPRYVLPDISYDTSFTATPMLESKDSHIALPYEPFDYKELEIPDVLVNAHGKLEAVPATTVIDDWKSKMYMPISGQKSGHFVVFCDKSRNLSKANLECFMSQFCHHYNELNFGTISEYPKCEPYLFATTSGLVDCIDKFFKTENVSEFQTVPILSFIFGSPIYNPGFIPRSILTYVRPGVVASADEEEIKSLAFVVYSRIRIMKTSPFGMWNLTNRESASLFFGFRYEPPFELRRQESIPTYVHIGYDKGNQLVAWMDSIGSVLQVQQIDSFDTLVSRMKDLYLLLNDSNVLFTLTILGESISCEFLDEINEKTNDIAISVYSCYPVGDVQVKLPDHIIGDVIHFSDPEQQFIQPDVCPNEAIAKPQKSCFVLNKYLPGYQISIYKSTITPSPEESLMRYATNMSKLSWLSVKPLCEKRTIAYPPHICAILRKNNANTDVVGPYEFLPMIEKI